MPIYEYQCNACGKVNEVMQKIGESAPASCDACSGGPLTKLLSKTGFILKGSGWYVTDFRGGSSSKPAAPAGGDKASGDSSSGSSSSDSGSSSTDSGSKTETKASAGGCATGCGHNH